MNIVAIEDDPAHLALITSLLAKLDQMPLAATDAETGLHMIDEQCPDLVLCDIRLPGVSGYDVVRRLKSNPATRGVPVIAVTAVAGQQEALQAGFDGYLTKPLTLRRLRSELERVLPGNAADECSGAITATATTWVKPQLPRSGKRILVLDNSEGNRELMRVLLDYGGHDVVCERTLAMAFDTARSWQPHLILCDVHLDKEFGTELLSAVQHTPELRGTLFAFTSASPGPSIEHQLLEAGACAYYRLPMKPEVLLAKIGQLLK